MNCATHPEVTSSGFCSQCGKALCPDCVRDVRGVIYCEECLAARVAGPPAPTRIPDAPRPGVALVLGFIPGVGAIYNGEYLKGFVHILIFFGLIGLVDSVGGAFAPLFGFMIAAFYIYMIIEAYQTAKRRALGLAPAPPGWGALGLTAAPGQATPIGPIILIGLGVLFLLETLDLFDFSYFRYVGRMWPLVLIAVGAWMLWKRTSAAPPPPPNAPPQEGPQA